MSWRRVSSSARTIVVLAIAAAGSAADVAAQRGRSFLVQLETDDAFDRASAVWIAPDGARTAICPDATDVDHPMVCSVVARNAGEGDYVLEIDIGLDGARVAQAFTLDLDGEEAAIHAHLSRTRVIWSVLAPAPPGLWIERAPARIHSETCEHVIRNGGGDALPGADRAWVVPPSLRDEDWISHARGEHDGSLEPDAERCLTLVPNSRARASRAWSSTSR